MPELPEVETIVRQLRPLLEGRTVRRLELFDPQLTAPNAGRIARCTMGRPERIGKWIHLPLLAPRPSAAGWHLLFHLRMTGRLLWSADGHDGCSGPPLRARLVLDRGALLFHDVRRLGTMRLEPATAPLPLAGLDPLSRRFTVKALAGLLPGVRQPLKPWLMRQDRLTGLGNIYASEILFAAGLDPFCMAGSLSDEAIARLHGATVAILRRAVELGGTSFSDYQNALGQKGGFQERLTVYGRAGQPCPHCGGPIERSIQAQRSTFYCPRCQRAEGRGRSQPA